VNAVPRQTELAVGPLVAAVGAVLLIVSLFLDWYAGITGFTVFEFIDLLLVLLALVTIAALAGGLGLVRPAVSPGLSLAVALFTIFVVLSQIINDPPAVVGPGPDKDVGLWLALSGSALMVAGAVLGYAHISLALETRPRDRAGEPDPDRDVASVATPAAPARPDPEPRRPVAFEDDPTRPLSGLADPDRPLTDPSAPRRPDDPARP
jgi:hypothetical protein